MNITFDKTSDAGGVLTLQIVKADYEKNFKNELVKVGKEAKIRGFRPGHIPTSLLIKLYGSQAKMVVVNRLVDESIHQYIKENNIDMLGFPLHHEGQEAQDLERQDDFEFKFDIAVTPDFNIELTSKDKVTYYDVKVDEAEVDTEIEQLKQQMGHNEEFNEYQEGDILRGLIAELDADGKPLEGGLQKENASLMPKYFKNDEQKKLFADTKKNDVIVFSPSEAYNGSEVELASLLGVKKEELGDHKESRYSFQVDEISRYVPATIGQEFFDNVLGEDQVKSEEEFRDRIRKNLESRAQGDADFRFTHDLREYCEKKVGPLAFDEGLLKRIMRENNKDKDADFVDKNYEEAVKDLTWQIIRDRLARQMNVKVSEQEIKDYAMMSARYQFMQYGMGNLPDKYLLRYAEDMLKDDRQKTSIIERILTQKTAAAAKNDVTLKRKSISREDFNKLEA